MAMRQVLLCWALLLLSLGLASSTQLVNGTFGGSAQFDVFLPIPTNFRIVWNFGEIGHVTVVGEISDREVPVYNPQYRGRSQLFDNGTLRLDNVTDADAGHYGLYVYDDDTFSTNIVLYNFKVFAALQAPSLSIVSDLIIHGTNVTLHCDAGDQTVTAYTFYRDQKMICSEPHVTCRGSFMELTPKSKDDSGSYTCRIENPVSSKTSDPIPVTVSGRPEATSLEYTEYTDPTRIIRVQQNQTLLIKIWQLVHMSISYGGDQHPVDDILDKQ